MFADVRLRIDTEGRCGDTSRMKTNPRTVALALVALWVCLAPVRLYAPSLLDPYRAPPEDDPTFGIPGPDNPAPPKEMARQMRVRQMNEQRADEAAKRKAFADEQARQQQAAQQSTTQAKRLADEYERRQATETAAAAIPKHAAGFPSKAWHDLPPEKQAQLNAQFPTVAWQLPKLWKITRPQ